MVGFGATPQRIHSEAGKVSLQCRPTGGEQFTQRTRYHWNRFAAQNVPRMKTKTADPARLDSCVGGEASMATNYSHK